MRTLDTPATSGQTKPGMTAADHLPSYPAFLRSLESLLAARRLSPKNRSVVKAFAVAVYRRALAQQTNRQVQSLVTEAIENALPQPRPSGTGEVRSHVYHVGFAFGSKRSKRRKSRPVFDPD